MGLFYRHIVRPALFALNPDTMHSACTALGEASGAVGPARWLLNHTYGYTGPDISKTVDGITYRTPVALAAGFDPDGRLTRILPALSFGGEDIGSVTAQPCAGNPPPHFTRLPRNRSIIVNKGLRNAGVDAIIKKLSHTPRAPGFVLGISIARTNAPDAAIDAEAGIRDYRTSLEKLVAAGIGDYYTINISCPNAYTGETFTDPVLLAQLLPRLREIPCKKPLYLKMPISVPEEQFFALCEIAERNGVNGLVIGNLNKNYTELAHPEDAPQTYCGGLSGTPCRARSVELIRETRERYGARFTLIGVGGIMTPDDAMEKFAAGADLVQLISGMIFEGPGLIKKICERYAETTRVSKA